MTNISAACLYESSREAALPLPFLIKGVDSFYSWNHLVDFLMKIELDKKFFLQLIGIWSFCHSKMFDLLLVSSRENNYCSFMENRGERRICIKYLKHYQNLLFHLKNKQGTNCTSLAVNSEKFCSHTFQGDHSYIGWKKISRRIKKDLPNFCKDIFS